MPPDVEEWASKKKKRDTYPANYGKETQTWIKRRTQFSRGSGSESNL